MGYAIGLPPDVLTDCADGRCIDWDGEHNVTCQMTAVVADFGVTANLEEFYRHHNVRGLRGLLYERRVSKGMTRRTECIRRREKT